MNKNLSAKDRIILALDVDTLEEARDIVQELKEHVGMFKVGLQLFSAVGPDVFKMIADEGAKVYFDGKFCEIPNIAAQASANIIKHGVDFLNINILGSSKMISKTIKASREAAKKAGRPNPIILGVTLLTSYGQRTLTEELGVTLNIEDYALKLAELAKQNGLDGVVATAEDAIKIREKLGEDFIIVCPAVRPTWSIVDDQVRVVTPHDAVRAKVDYIIVGRPIRNAEDRTAAAELIAGEILEAMIEV